MAETAAHHVVNSTQSVGEPAPIDAPKETQDTNRVVGEALGDDTTRAADISEQLAQDVPLSTTSAQSDINSESLQHNAGAQKETVRNTPPSSEEGHALIRSDAQIPVHAASQDQVSAGSGESAAEPNGVISTTSFAEPSPTPVNEDGEPEWRRTASQAQEPLTRERSASIKKPTAFKSVSVTKNFLAKSTTAPPNKLAPDKGMQADALQCTPYLLFMQLHLRVRHPWQVKIRPSLASSRSLSGMQGPRQSPGKGARRVLMPVRFGIEIDVSS